MADPAMKGDLRRRILDTASHILVHEGYASLSMRRIARSIEYSATSIYLYFENKEALLNELIDDGMKWMYERMSVVEKTSYPSLVEKLEAVARTYIEFGLDHPEYYEIMFIAHPERATRFPPELYRRSRRNLNVAYQVLVEGNETGVFDVPDPRVAASSMWATMHGVVSLLLAQRVDVAINNEQFIEEAIRQVTHGVLTRTP